MAKAKTAKTSDWRDGFLFVGNQIALDFVNTCPLEDGEPLELLPDFNAVVRWYRAAGLITSIEAGKLEQQWNNSTRAQNFTAKLRQFRESLRSKILLWEDTGKLRKGAFDEINELMTNHPMLSRVKANASEATTELWFKLTEPEDLFAPLANSAAILFATADRSRLRKCGHCVLHFYDISKKGTRRWCSMQLCGNRLKVAAYATRNRSSK